jgi:nucleotide-binding universal stress UspA family protein
VFKTIVLGLDGSDNSKRAIAPAVEMARAGGGRVVLAHVDERIPTRGGPASVRVDDDETGTEVAAEAERLAADGVDVSVENVATVLGGPAQAIAAIADEVDADLIVVGTRGHSAVAGLLLGSVTNRLLHVAKRPVLAVPPGD